MKVELAVIVLIAVLVPKGGAYINQHATWRAALSALGMGDVRLPPMMPQSVQRMLTHQQHQALRQHQAHTQVHRTPVPTQSARPAAARPVVAPKPTPAAARQQAAKSATTKPSAHLGIDPAIRRDISLLSRLRSLTPHQLVNLTNSLNLRQRLHMKRRIAYIHNYLKHNRGEVSARDNLVLSGANKVRQLPSAQNSVSGGATDPKAGTAATTPSAGRKMPMSPAMRAQLVRKLLATIRARQQQRQAAAGGSGGSGNSGYYTAYRRYRKSKKKASGALTAGCRYMMPLDSPMDTYLMFGMGMTCRMGGDALCAMKHMQCVDHGSSMCCPMGYSSGAIDMINYMNRMQSFIAQFS